ncbi:MAG: preprotein translocase subunit SecA [Candidatus Marinimicrobia bacterium]|nr:preprotein translocase subunit SecA [Candidatus Neomarinimicrobiota bacterium]
MISKFITRIFGTSSDRETRQLLPLVAQINEQYDALSEATQETLISKTTAFKASISEEIEKLQVELENGGKDHKEISAAIYDREQEILSELLPEAFAVVKKGAELLMGQAIQVTGQELTWDMIPYDVQLMGAVVLHEGKISEMKTGEGKTLVATMPIYLNALVGRGVHIITVNDYLAERDSQWMGALIKYVGLSVGVILNQMEPSVRQENYNCDVTYGINSEFGFDYLRDNMSISKQDQVQRGHYYAIVDEVDSVLIDEARTPLIISGTVDSPIAQRYTDLRPLVDDLMRRQTSLVNSILAKAEEKLKDPKTEYEAGELILQARRGSPKHRRLQKLYQEQGIKKLEQRIENDYLRDKRMPELDEELYFVIEERQNSVDLTDKGRDALSPNDPDRFVIPDLPTLLNDLESDTETPIAVINENKEKLYALHGERSDTIHNLSQLLKAYSLFEKDVDYVVQEGKVMIVDEFTGRIMHGRRYSDGLHQALEAKEKVRIEKESQTLATITLQNYFRLYKKLAGMTGTAVTESEEFFSIYKLGVIEVPTHRDIVRVDENDQIFKTRREKFNAVIEEIIASHKSGQPVLVGTITVEVSETLSRMLKRLKIPHNVLNAKQHGREAEVVARAGQAHAVTIATNMAGRGTDIKLGPNVKELGGLKILGTERHESRRIDLQLRGRAGRQGDPGASRFYLSLEDDLMRLFSSDRVASVMDRLGLQEGEVIEAGMVTKAVERAQKKVEARNYSIRKHLLEYDNVMNQQREVIYDRRQAALDGLDLKEEFREVMENYADSVVEKYTNLETDIELWDWNDLQSDLMATAMVHLPDKPALDLDLDKLREVVSKLLWDTYDEKATITGSEANFKRLQQFVYLRVVDEKWREHLYEMDQMKEGINLRAVGQKDPLIEYKKEGYQLFVKMLDLIDRDVLKLFFHARIVDEGENRVRRARNLSTRHAETSNMGFLNTLPQTDPGRSSGAAPPQVPQKLKPITVDEKIGRNDLCPCGSGLKYKKCHGK